MDRVLNIVGVRAGWLALVVAAGCSSASSKLVGGGAVLSAVANDQSWVAALASPTRLSTGVHLGKLEIVPVTGGGDPLILDERSAGGRFNRGTALWYLGSVSVVNEGTPATPHVYGGLYVWTTEMASPVRVGDNVREFYPSQDGSACVFMDWDQKTVDASNTGTLKAVSAPRCAAGMCNAVQLDSGITLAQAAWRISTDGRLVFATVRGAGVGDPGKRILLALDGGDTPVVTEGVGIRSAMMSPGGDTIAWVEGANQLMALATANPDSVQTFTVDAPIVETAEMIDSGRYVVKVRDAAGAGAARLAKVTASGTTPLGVDKPLEYVVSQQVPGVTTSYLFYALNRSASGQPDLWMLDLTAASPTPLQLGAEVEQPLGAGIAFSDDGTTIHYLDSYDPTTRRGDAFVVRLASPTRTLVATTVRELVFVPHSTRLMYINAPDATTDAGVMTLLPSLQQAPVVEGVGEVNFVDARTRPLRTYFTQQTGGRDDGVWYISQP
jgi:hypothetical protein